MSAESVQERKKGSLNTPAPNVPFYTPIQNPPVGTPEHDNEGTLPTLFTPLRIRSLTLQNRFMVSPMCMYSADDGHLTDFHLVHLGAFAMRGAALVCVEATGVLANGRITPEDSGLWQDSQIAPLRRITDFVHSQGQKAAIQLAHAGRKASTRAPWLSRPGDKEVATAEEGGWPDNVWAPSAIPYADTYPSPVAMTEAQIQELKQAYAEAAVRALKAGFDVIEIHAAHGYLFTEFMSPISNKRTDKYGGSFENRMRLLIEVIRVVRAVIPESMPLFVRISATEWMDWTGEPSFNVDEAEKLALLLPELGVDLLDVSSGGNNPQQKIHITPDYQISIAARLRAALRKAGKKMLIGAVGMITTAEMARETVEKKGEHEHVKVDGEQPQQQQQLNGDSAQQNGGVSIEDEQGLEAKADLVIIARQFLREPEFVLRTAHQLGVSVKWPSQYGRAAWKRDQQVK